MIDEQALLENPFVRFVCGTCRDIRRTAAPEGTAGTIPCHVCGTDEQRRAVFGRSALVPTLHVLDLTDEELVLFRGWKARSHDLDCLRWIEGRRYNPSKDPAFLAECESRLALWRKVRDEAGRERAIFEAASPKTPPSDGPSPRTASHAPPAPRHGPTAGEAAPFPFPKTKAAEEPPEETNGQKRGQKTKESDYPTRAPGSFGAVLDELDGVPAHSEPEKPATEPEPPW